MPQSLVLAPGLKLPHEAVTQTFAILAKRGAGKTYTMLVLAEELIKNHLPLVILDPVGVCWGLRLAADGKSKGLPIVVMGGEHGDLPLDENMGEQVADVVVDEHVSMVLDMSLMRKGARKRFVADFMEQLYLRNREPLMVMMDEADTFAPQRPIKGEERMLGAIEDAVRRGRARGLGIIMVTQRASVLNKDVLTQIEVLIAMRTVGRPDLNAISSWVQAHGEESIHDSMLADLPSLPKGTAWVWSPGWLEIFKKVKIRRRETFDSSATPEVGQKRVRPRPLAPADVERLRERFAAVVEEHEQNDPVILRRRIAELERGRGRPAAAPARPQIQVREVERIVKVPAIKARLVKRLQAMVEQLNTTAARATKAAEALANQLSRKRGLQVDGQPVEVVGRPGDIHRDGFAVVVPRREEPPPRRAAPAERRQDPMAEIPKGEKTVLKAVAMWQGGAERDTLTVLTGYKRSSRDAYIQRLKDKGLVEASGDKVRITAFGITVLGPDYEPLPEGPALLVHWRTRLPAGERKVLDAIVHHYPQAVERDSVSETTGYKRSSRDAYIQRLKSRRLVEFDGDRVRASHLLF